MTRFLRAGLALVLFTLAACANVAHEPIATEAPPVLLVSIDGFHPSYLDRGMTPHLSRIAAEGVRADGLRPSYPTLTFPNHFTLVTGMRPARHGIVHNTMRDPVLGAFKSSNADNAGDARWWNGAEPLWVTAERAGVRTATMFWPGSQAAIRGVRPTHWRPFDASFPNDARVDQVVAWLSARAPRVRFATLYFELLDQTGHAFGPHSPQVDRDIAAIDATIGRLLGELEAHDLRPNLVIVSDHGMAEVAPGHLVAIEDMVDPGDAEAIATGQVVGFAPRRGRERAAEAALLGRHAHYACWKRDAIPARWRYDANPRVPPILCQFDEGWAAIPRADFARVPAHALGAHGFDPALPSMRGMFIASGPAFRRGVQLPVIDNVDVYPLLARLVGVPPLAGDGTLEPFLPALGREAR